MCGMMCGKVQVCTKYVPSAVTPNHLIGSVRISARGMVGDQSASSVKVEVLGVSCGTLNKDYNSKHNGTQGLPVTLPKNRLHRYLLSVASVASRLEVDTTYTGSTIRAITRLQMWLLPTKLVTQNILDKNFNNLESEVV